MSTLKIEDLATVMKSVTFDANDLKLWKNIKMCSCRHPWGPTNINTLPRMKLFNLLHKLMHESPYA
jgi:hypothetical protein